MQSDRAMSQATSLVTAEQLERTPELERFELWDGRLVPMNPVSPLHGRVVVRFASLLDQHVRQGRLGYVMAELGVRLRSNPDTVFGPDIAFISRERMPETQVRGFWQGPPDLAVEVLSPDDSPGAVRRKIDEYLLRGTPMVLVIDPQKRTTTIHRPDQKPTILSNEDMLDLSDVVAGFRCPVAAIFE